jgi:2-polyprenyl-3-methyl-5-hydroxy-6-metoxy-1,4-benzoquinol methylase
LRPRNAEEFDAAYNAAPAWDIGQPQLAFKQVAESGGLRGRVLDVGCGTGEHALMAAELGLAAVGVDGSQTAISIAEKKALERGLNARFKVGNALELSQLGERFDTLLDCGLFHVLSDEARGEYVASLAGVAEPGATFIMLCFSDRQPGTVGPRRVSQDDIRAQFGAGWEIERIEESRFVTSIHPKGAHAWLATIRRA